MNHFPNRLIIETVSDKYKQQLLEMQIDKGELSAIALDLETPESTVILDEYRAKKIADQLAVNYTGTIGVIIRAKINQRIHNAVNPLLTALVGRQQPNPSLPLTAPFRFVQF